VTIIIAIVLLATISFVSFSLSSVILREIRAARLVQNSEPALASANSGGEVSLYRLQRNIGGISVSGVAMQSSGATFDVVPDLTDTQFPFTATANDAFVSIYNPDSLTTADTGARSVRVTNNGPRHADIWVRPWSNSETVRCFFNNVNPGDSRTCNLLGPDYRYQIHIQRTGGGGQNALGFVEAFTGPDATGSALGIPSASPVLDVTGRHSEVQRKIRVNLSQ